MSRRVWTAFAVVQGLGVLLVWAGPRIMTAAGPVLLGAGGWQRDSMGPSLPKSKCKSRIGWRTL